MLSRALICFLILVTVASCARRINYHEFDGHHFRANARSERGERANFTVRVNNIDRSIDGAREAGRYEATKHCLRFYGTSLVDWVNGPDDEALQTEGGTLILSGTCVE